MSHSFLLEIGLEEIPAKLVTASSKQLKEKTAKFLEDNRLSYGSIEEFSTPRRLGVRINQLAEKQADVEEEAKGPAKKIAVDEAGEWTKAAQGFAKGQGVAPSEIYFKELKGVEYVHVTKFIAGKTAAEVLPDVLTVIKNMTFPVSMHWASNKFKYIRPIHWLVALLDDQVVPFELLDIKTDRVSRGHRFLGQEAVIDHAANYEDKLEEQFVYAKADVREAIIVKQINDIATTHKWTVELDPALLNEVNNLVEYPTAFSGDFAENYLAIPDEALVTTMKEHQRYFDVRDQSGKLLPHFISVRNGNAAYLENVIKGNEKVLTARLEDADFFYKDDQELSIAECVAKLKNVTFHEKIGSIYEKMQRVGVIAQLIGQEVGLTQRELSQLDRAAGIYKFDLVTNMVGEFPELQGIMGEKYALMQGEDPAVAQAIREHYLPISSEGDLPETKIGAVLAIADKTDSVVAFFNAGMIPSGSNDPYALRRQTYGIIRINAAMGWSYPVIRLQNKIAEKINQDFDRYGLELADSQVSLTDFMKGRMKQYLATKGIRHDIIEAVTNAEQSDLATMAEAAMILKERHEDSDFKPSVEALTRVMNLAVKGHELMAQEVEKPVEPALFENDSEKELYQAVSRVEANMAKQTLAESYDALKDLSPLIEVYFEQTMVMSDDTAIRENRLRQLFRIASLVLSIASLDLLVVK